QVHQLRLSARGHQCARRLLAEPARGAASSQGRRLQPRHHRRHPHRNRPGVHPGPTPGVDLWWSGKHDNHGGNVQVITVPDGWPTWPCDVRPGREHDPTAVRTHTEILPTLAEAAADLRTLGDLGYEGESDTITVAFKKPKGGRLTLVQQQLNEAHNGIWHPS